MQSAITTPARVEGPVVTGRKASTRAPLVRLHSKRRRAERSRSIDAAAAEHATLDELAPCPFEAWAAHEEVLAALAAWDAEEDVEAQAWADLAAGRLAPAIAELGDAITADLYGTALDLSAGGFTIVAA